MAAGRRELSGGSHIVIPAREWEEPRRDKLELTLPQIPEEPALLTLPRLELPASSTSEWALL